MMLEELEFPKICTLVLFSTKVLLLLTAYASCIHLHHQQFPKWQALLCRYNKAYECHQNRHARWLMLLYPFLRPAPVMTTGREKMS